MGIAHPQWTRARKKGQRSWPCPQRSRSKVRTLIPRGQGQRSRLWAQRSRSKVMTLTPRGQGQRSQPWPLELKVKGHDIDLEVKVKSHDLGPPEVKVKGPTLAPRGQVKCHDLDPKVKGHGQGHVHWWPSGCRGISTPTSTTPYSTIGASTCIGYEAVWLYPSTDWLNENGILF